MASRHLYAVGTDDAGSIAAADIEVGTVLHTLAASPPDDPVVAIEILLGLEPAQALALCESSDFYQEICDRWSFKDQYRFDWHVKVQLVGLGVDQTTYSLFRTRDVGDAKELYERDTGLARTEYAFFLRQVPARTTRDVFQTPTAQSSLGGVTALAVVQFNVVRADQTVVSFPDQTLTHWFANGETIELSE